VLIGPSSISEPKRPTLIFRLVIGATLVFAIAAPALAQVAPVGKNFRTRGIVGGWGHSWQPIFGQTETDIDFAAFHPRMGWFVAERLELYGEGTLFLYRRPEAAVSAGLAGISGRYYFKSEGRWIPYAHAGAGLLWTSLDVPEIDRIFNFQLIMGAGVRQTRAKGPCLVLEFRNHHISNADTAGKNMGINAAVLLGGIEWVLRPN
jgi:hypothetical protein